MSILDFDPKIHFITDPDTRKRTTIYEFWDHYLSYREGRKEPKRFEKRVSSTSTIPASISVSTDTAQHI